MKITIEILIDRSSLGEPLVRRLRSRTPAEIAKKIIERVPPRKFAFGSEPWATYQLSNNQGPQDMATAEPANTRPTAPEMLPGPTTPTVLRPARALIGWMSRDQAILTLAGREVGSFDPRLGIRADTARAHVMGRPAGIKQDDALSLAPAEVANYAKDLLQQPVMAPFLKEGWSVRLVNLRKIAAIQPLIYSDGWNTKIQFTGNPSVLELAQITLPPPGNSDLPVQFDNARNAWILSSPNPNLRVLGNAHGQGLLGFGVGCPPSVMQVAKLGHRLVLRDGYNRAYALLRRGIEVVPCLFREFPEQQDLGVSSGMLAPSVYLGYRPPTLADYLDDDVAAEVTTRSVRKIIIIQALETVVE